MTESKSILTKIQQELKAPKNQRNNFGGYNYRSCEDILEALKPLLDKHDATLTISDEIVLVGDRYYVRATAKLVSEKETYTTSAYAREAENKKGMDESQITGTASSYARKYCLNGLFCIDDTKDADTNEHKKQTAGAPEATGKIYKKSGLDFDAVGKKLKDITTEDELNDYWRTLKPSTEKQTSALKAMFARRKAEL